jgi:hypothetical protein
MRGVLGVRAVIKGQTHHRSFCTHTEQCIGLRTQTGFTGTGAFYLGGSSTEHPRIILLPKPTRSPRRTTTYSTQQTATCSTKPCSPAYGVANCVDRAIARLSVARRIHPTIMAKEWGQSEASALLGPGSTPINQVSAGRSRTKQHVRVLMCTCFSVRERALRYASAHVQRRAATGGKIRPPGLPIGASTSTT